MESTNHNLWTLTKHVAVSVNKGAGKIDFKICGDKTNAVAHVPPPAPKEPEKPVNPLAPSGVGLLLAIVIVLGTCAYVYRKKIW